MYRNNPNPSSLPNSTINTPPSAKPQESSETPIKPSDKPASSVKGCGLNLLFPDSLNIHRPQK